MQNEFMTIGLFQLENLINMRSPFIFFDLSSRDREKLSSALLPILSVAIKISADKIEQHLRELKTQHDFPLVLLCDEGVHSTQVGLRLQTLGFNNIYIVEGGLTSLELEIRGN